MWKCKECKKVCRQKNKLSWHVEIHLDGFVNKCTLCAKTFKTRNSLNGHIYTIHKSKGEIYDMKATSNSKSDPEYLLEDQVDNSAGKWKCTICGEMMKSKWKLKTHMAAH